LTDDSPRIAPLPVEVWPPEAHEAYGVLKSEKTAALGAASNMTMTLANHPALGKAFYTFGRHLLLESSLADRPRELATLRVAWRYRNEYEWHHHVRFGLRIGLSDAEIEATKGDPANPIWSEFDRCVLRATDQLCGSGGVDDATWAELGRHLDQRQLMDLVFTIGQYAMLSWAVASFKVQLEPGFTVAEHPLA
jgi:alkylhydroperoxidase family enzyme